MRFARNEKRRGKTAAFFVPTRNWRRGKTAAFFCAYQELAPRFFTAAFFGREVLADPTASAMD
jgi:hypothetical protein